MTRSSDGDEVLKLDQSRLVKQPCEAISRTHLPDRGQVERAPQLQARGFIQKFLHREVNELFETESLPIKFSLTEASVRQGAPPLGGDNEYVLREIMGLSEEEIATLAEEAIL